MGRKEDLSDMMIDRAYTDKDERGRFVFHKGKVLKFDYEGTPIHIRITKIDRKNKKMYGEHISLYDFNTGMSHYGHDIDASDKERIFCRDCNVEISQPATEEGEVKAIMRQREEDKIDEKQQAKRDRNRRFRYELLKQDGTIKKFDTGKRKKVSEIQKILGARQVGVVPVVYYPQKYEHVAIYSDQDIDWSGNSVKNPHLLTIPGDPDLGEQEEFYIVGDALAEIEVTK
jgi:hypothetical protein